MRTYAHARMLALLAALALAVAADQASAEALSVSSQTFRATWSALTFSGGFGRAVCPVTLEGSFHQRSMTKTAGSLIGYVTKAVTSRCSTGSATILAASLPWHVRYSSFSGTLPNITALNLSLIGAAVNIREPVFGIECLLSGEAMTFAMSREAGGNFTTVAVGGTIPTSCGVNSSASGSAPVTVLGSTTRVALTLIEVALGVLEATPARVILERNREREPVVLRNTDTAKEMTVEPIFEIAGRFEYSQEARCGMNLPPRGACTITIRIREAFGQRGGVTALYNLVPPLLTLRRRLIEATS